MTEIQKTTMIAAVSLNGGIGLNNKLPWDLPGDLKHFKETTRGHVLVMGRKTWDSFGGRMLPGRHHVVISSNVVPPPVARAAEWEFDSSRTVMGALTHALVLARKKECNIFVIGGATIYEAAMQYADELLITHLDQRFPADTFFPTIGPEWIEIDTTKLKDQTIPNRVSRYVRKSDTNHT